MGEPNATDSGSGPRPRILIVEDSADAAHLIEEVLRAHEYEVAGRATSAKDAVRLTLSLRPDLVLMDIFLEGAVDGIEAARVILEDTDCPVVFLTGHTSDDLVARAKALNPHGYLVKPLHIEGLPPTIELALERARREREEAEALGNQSEP